MLLKEFLEPLGITQLELSRHLGWPYARLNEIVNGRRGISADSALAISDALGTGPEFWLKLQYDWNLWNSRKQHKKIPLLKKAASSEQAAGI